MRGWIAGGRPLPSSDASLPGPQLTAPPPGVRQQGAVGDVGADVCARAIHVFAALFCSVLLAYACCLVGWCCWSLVGPVYRAYPPHIQVASSRVAGWRYCFAVVPFFIAWAVQVRCVSVPWFGGIAVPVIRQRAEGRVRATAGS